MVLAAIVGRLGSGKTLYLVREIYFHIMLAQWTAFCNFNLKGLGYYELTEPLDIYRIRYGNFTKKLIALDEGYMWFDSLEKSSQKQKFYRNLINISRKLKLKIIFTTQTIGQIYYRNRLLFDYIVHPIYNKRADSMKCTFMYPNLYGDMEHLKTIKIKNVSNFFKYYDSWEIQEYFNLDDEVNNSINDFINQPTLNDFSTILEGIEA